MRARETMARDKWDFDQEEREQIQQWREKRLRKMSDRTSHFLFYLRTFNLETVRSFAQNLNLMVVLQMVLAAMSVYVFQVYNISFDIHICLFVSPIVFPLAFCIDTDFQRRERVLEDLATFRSSAMIYYFCMRDWKSAAYLDDGWLRAVQSKMKSILFHLREYLLTSKVDRRKVILCAIYEDFSDVNQLIERIRASKLPSNGAIVSRAIHLLNMMCQSFERLRTVREYRSPRSIRSFNKVFIMFLPIILAPYFVGVGEKSGSVWQPYCIAVIIAFVFATLQGAQDMLDDPFNGMSEDDINMDTFDELNYSLEHTMKRTFAIGRFKVSVEETRSRSARHSRVSRSSLLFDNTNNNNINNNSVNGLKNERKSSIVRKKSAVKMNSLNNRLKAYSNMDLQTSPTNHRHRKVSANRFMSTLSRESSVNSFGGYTISEIPETTTTLLDLVQPEDTMSERETNIDVQAPASEIAGENTEQRRPVWNAGHDEPKPPTDLTKIGAHQSNPRSSYTLPTPPFSSCVSEENNDTTEIVPEHSMMRNSAISSHISTIEADENVDSNTNEEAHSLLDIKTEGIECIDETEFDVSSRRAPTRKNADVTPPELSDVSVPSLTTSYYEQDWEEGSYHSEEDDDDDVQSLLSEWQQIDAVLRREIFSTKQLSDE